MGAQIEACGGAVEKFIGDAVMGVSGERRARQNPHHGIADELLDGSAAGLDLGPDPLEVRRLDRPNVFRIERSERAVKPTRSAKSTETIFRSSRALPWSAVRRVPQALQNFASGGFSRPQLGQTFTP